MAKCYTNSVVAYFSSEYAINDGAPTFAGGLGVLAGDYLAETNKQKFPLVGLGLAYGGNPTGFTKLSFDLPFTVWQKDNLYLLDSGDELMKQPYGPDYWTMIKQQLFLAFNGLKLLNFLNLKPDIYHLNEGHTAFVILALMKENKDFKIVSTKHTILSEAGLFIPRADLKEILKMVWPEADEEKIFELGKDLDQSHYEMFSTTKFMLVHSQKSNGVSIKHCQAEKESHPHSPLIPITNGINPDRWQGLHDRKNLIEFINKTAGSHFDPNVLTVVWARRLAAYKQPELLLSNLRNLSDLPMQFIVAGPVNTTDPSSLAIANKLRQITLSNFTFLPHYSLSIAKILVSGADVWLNTPVVGKEACGTSGMKAGLNGALLISTIDGWIAEVKEEEIGWFIKDATDLYKKLALAGDLFYNHPDEWAKRSENIKNLIKTKFTAARMLQDYKEKLYA